MRLAGYAFPGPSFTMQGEIIAERLGLTKREYFAALAMQGILVNGSLLYQDKALGAKCAVGYADALIDALGAKP